MLLLQLLGGAIAVIALYLTYSKIKKGEEIEQNFVSWVLWGILDTITSISTILAGGNFILPVFYALGAFSVSFILFKRQKIKWTLIESFTVFSILICLIIWWKTGNINSIIACTIAILLSGVPQIIDTWEKPTKTPTLIYLYFSLAEITSFFGGKFWTIEDKLYAGTQFIICIFIILLSIKKEDRSKKNLHFLKSAKGAH